MAIRFAWPLTQKQFPVNRKSIKAAGQTAIGLVRPHPNLPRHFEVAAGSRRRLACELECISFRAEIRDIPNQAHEVLFTDSS